MVSFTGENSWKPLGDFPKPISPSEVQDIQPGVCYGLMEVDSKTQQVKRLLWREVLLPKEVFDKTVTYAKDMIDLERKKLIEEASVQAQMYLERKEKEDVEFKKSLLFPVRPTTHQIEVPSEMLRKIVRIYAEMYVWAKLHYEVKRVRVEEQIGERKLDIVIDTPSGNIFIEVRTETPPPEFIEDYFRFCEKYSPDEAWLVAPEAASTTRYLPSRVLWENRIITPPFKVISIDELLGELRYGFDIKFETIDGLFRLVLSSKKRQH